MLAGWRSQPPSSAPPHVPSNSFVRILLGGGTLTLASPARASVNGTPPCALAAQVAWSEGAVGEREALQAELADTRSALHAQVAWSEQAVVVREALQAEYEALEHALATERHRGDDLQSRLSRYEATLVGRLQRRWMAWRDGRAQLRKDTTR